MISLVQQYFSASALAFPDKTAISCQDQNISFSEAEAFTNGVAHLLRDEGCRRNDFVPFFIKKSVNAILSMVSILKSDCAYVPIDTNSPAQRLVAILEATHASHILVDNETEDRLRTLLPDSHDINFINIDQCQVTNTSPVRYQNLSIDIAYVLFTSGSTGVPKGVMISHKAIIDYIENCVEFFGLTSNDVISNHAPLYFDLTTFDTYCAFKTGASLHLVHDELNLIPPRLVKWLGDNKITTLFCVPSVLTLMLKSRRLKDGSFPNLRHIICAGEVLPPDVLKAWMEKYPHIQFTNMYGPTEITVTCTQYVVTQVPDNETRSIPIGHTRNNMELFIRTEDGLITKQADIQGELLVRGTSVAYGYLGDTEKTAKAFIQNPTSVFHDPLYCTGDLVSFSDDGNVNYFGRIDHQIKHMGYRIEIGEIEAALVGLPQVEEGIVVFGKNPETDENNIGALVSLCEPMDPQSIKDQLRSKLPAYMIPTKIIVAAGDFPRTPNGKYDRKSALKQVF